MTRLEIAAITPVQRAKWIEAVAPVWKEYSEKLVGADVMARLREVAAADP